MAAKRVQITIGDPTTGESRIVVDGVDLTNVVNGVEVIGKAGKFPVVVLYVLSKSVEVDADAVMSTSIDAPAELASGQRALHITDEQRAALFGDQFSGSIDRTDNSVSSAIS